MPSSVPARPRSTRTLVGAALGLLGLVVLLVTSALFYAEADREVDHTLEVRRKAGDWVAAVLKVETFGRDLALAANPGFSESYEAALLRERREAAALRRLVGGNATQVQNVDLADLYAQTSISGIRDMVALVRAGHQSEAVERLTAEHSRGAREAYLEAMTAIRREEQRALRERRRRAKSLAWLTVLGGTLLPLTSCVLMIFAWRRERTHERQVKAMAVEARQRLANLFEVARALADARTCAQVADVIVEQGAGAAGADTCMLYLLSENGREMRLIGDRGMPRTRLEPLRRVPVDDSTGPHTEPLWVESRDRYESLLPELAQKAASGPSERVDEHVDEPQVHAFWRLPLYVEGHVIGMLGMGYFRPRRFRLDDRAYIDALAKQSAQALQRAQWLEGEDEANRRFTTTLRSLGDAVIATDEQGRIEFMNPVAEALTEWPFVEARGRPLGDVFCVFSGGTREPLENPVHKILGEGHATPLADETLLRSRHGRELPIDDSGAPIRSEEGELFGVVLVFRDITRERQERNRREFLTKAGAVLVSSLEYEETLRSVAQLAVPTLADFCAVEHLDSVRGGYHITVAHADPARAALARKAYERHPRRLSGKLGRSEPPLSDRAELVPEVSLERLTALSQDSEHLASLRELGLTSAMLVPLRTGRGTLGTLIFAYADSGRSYSEDDLVFAEDFARRAATAIENALVLREAETARAREQALRTEAESANRAKDEFLATVSHELRTPLNAILGWAVILREREPDGEIDRGLAVIERNARAQAKLIEDVLDVSRIISGKLTLTLAATHVAEAVSAAVETVTPAADAKGIALVAHLPEASLTTLADPDRLQQMVWNLLSNAVKFTPEGGQVTVRAWVEDSDVMIEVSDTGEGMRPEALSLVFEPFQQADASTTRTHGGLGLGLAIVKQLANAHGGNVQAFSEGPGLGARFLLQLPARVGKPAVAGAPTPDLEGVAPRPAQLAGLQLLVVDDDEDALDMVCEVLRGQGASVEAVGSVDLALQRLASVRPDVLISDIGMPEQDGFSLIRQLRALPPAEGGRTPALALTAYSRGKDAQRAFAAGFQMHLAKPVEPAQLVTVVANLGGRSLE